MNNQNSNTYYLIFFGLIFLLFLNSCAPNELTLDEYGFWSGMGHGFLSPFVIIGKYFNMDVAVVAQNTTGFTYQLGFGIGMILFFIAGFAGAGIPSLIAIVLWLLYYFGKI